MLVSQQTVREQRFGEFEVIITLLSKYWPEKALQGMTGVWSSA
jgi:hypothetical protein